MKYYVFVLYRIIISTVLKSDCCWFCVYTEFCFFLFSHHGPKNNYKAISSIFSAKWILSGVYSCTSIIIWYICSFLSKLIIWNLLVCTRLVLQRVFTIIVVDCFLCVGSIFLQDYYRFSYPQVILQLCNIYCHRSSSFVV